MEDKNEGDQKMEEVMLPGFRFHPTDEELVSFYLKRKVQHRPLSIELIRQLDIYKYDPWDLPKFAMTGEKEWYFYCPRDRKYRNSARPNRVTGAGFWKATGTDRPIYSSEGHQCIGLKKSLVFYKGRAAKGVKTDWMMHEFRLPSLSDPSSPSPTSFLDRSLSPTVDSWAICRIFKKTNATAQRALSHSFVSSLPPETTINTLNKSSPNTTLFSPDKNPKTSSSYIQFQHQNIKNTQQQPYSDDNTTNTSTSTATPFSYFDFTSYHKPTNFANPISCLDQDLTSFLLAPQEMQLHFPKFTANDISSFLLNMSSGSSVLGEYADHLDSANINFGAVLAQEQCPALVSLPQEYQKNGDNNCSSNAQMKNMGGADDHEDHQYWDTIRSLGFAFGDYSAASTVEDHQDLKQNILLENFYSSSSIDGDLPAACFSTTKCFT